MLVLRYTLRSLFRAPGFAVLGVVVMMAAVGVTACWIPAARAARIDPATALRAQ